MTTDAGNKLICEFMGAKLSKLSKHGEYRFEASPSQEYASLYWQIKQLKYHLSWGWLMPVVEKIESFNLEVEIFRNQCWINWSGGGADEHPWLAKFDDMDIHHKGGESTTKIDAVWNAITQFTQWYNQQVSVKK